jgi:hypothetical protein
MSDQDPERHYHMHAFAFDFREMPSVFSRIMLEEQARFVYRAI